MILKLLQSKFYKYIFHPHLFSNIMSTFIFCLQRIDWEFKCTETSENLPKWPWSVGGFADYKRQWNEKCVEIGWRTSTNWTKNDCIETKSAFYAINKSNDCSVVLKIPKKFYHELCSKHDRNWQALQWLLRSRFHQKNSSNTLTGL